MSLDPPTRTHVPRTVEELDEVLSTPSDKVIEAIKRCPGRMMVLGAGGKMGFNICQMLHRAQQALGRTEPVIAVSRFSDAAVRNRFASQGIEVHAADLSLREEVESLPDAENVFFLAGVKFGTGSQPELLQRFNIEMPILVADRFATSRIVAMSTGCVYAFTTPESGGSTEGSLVEPPGAYARSCLGRENAFVTGSLTHGTRCSLIRLNYAIDLRYGVLVDIARKVRDGQPVNVEMGYVNVIWQRDAVDHILQSLPRASSPPLILNVTGKQVLSVRDLAERFAATFGTTAIIEGSEAPNAWLSNPARSHQMFGPPHISVDQMISWIASWLEQGGELLDKPTHFEVRDGTY